jgi:hypothetical protein
VYKPLLGLCSSGKFLGIFQRSFVSLMVRGLTRNGPYTKTLCAILKKIRDKLKTEDEK